MTEGRRMRGKRRQSWMSSGTASMSATIRVVRSQAKAVIRRSAKIQVVTSRD